jgi:hypothetical protein
MMTRTAHLKAKNQLAGFAVLTSESICTNIADGKKTLARKIYGKVPNPLPSIVLVSLNSHGRYACVLIMTATIVRVDIPRKFHARIAILFNLFLEIRKPIIGAVMPMPISKLYPSNVAAHGSMCSINRPNNSNSTTILKV